VDLPRTLLVIALSVLGPAMVAGQDAKPVVYNAGDGVGAPRVLESVTPTYTPEARTARIQGTVTVEAIVLPDGKVGDVTVAKSELWPYRGRARRTPELSCCSHQPKS
jgi:Gram-negative bacterial TonB protein C-terminal